MKQTVLTQLLNHADRKIVQESVKNLQGKYEFRNAEFLKLKSEKEKSEQQYQNLTGTHMALLREYEHLQEIHQKHMREYQASGDKFNKELSELKKEIQKYQKSEQALNTELSALKREVCRKEELLNQKTKETVLYRKFTIDKRNCFTLNKKNVHLGD